MRLPKLRELKEAVIAVFSPRFTTWFPAKPCEVPEKYRGKPEFNDETCIGCGACVNVCPTDALTLVDEIEQNPPIRKIIQRHDACIFCGNCSDKCTTQDGIKLSDKWDLATMDRESIIETRQYELQLCEKCGALIGAKKQLFWICEKLGPLAYTNPSLLLAKSKQLSENPEHSAQQASVRADVQPRDFMKILCPECKCEVNIRL